MNAILLDALPAELRHLSAASSSSPQPYDALCAAVLARYGETYRPLAGTREFRVSPPSARVAPPGPQPSHDCDLPSSATSPPPLVRPPAQRFLHPTSRPTRFRTLLLLSTSPPRVSTTASAPHALDAATDNVSPAVRPSLVEVSPSTISERDLPSTSKLCESFQQRPASPSTSTAAEVRAPYQLQPHLRDAATMTEAPEDDMPAGSPMAEQAAHVPATSAGIQLLDLRTSPRVPPAEGASTRTVEEPSGSPSPSWAFPGAETAIKGIFSDVDDFDLLDDHKVQAEVTAVTLSDNTDPMLLEEQNTHEPLEVS
ncbi:hypothetical protein HPB52_016918 [Rhipicephalus sanguineus]|uniref:Uncharacterized protein n=1 Tax=Rhipicephalus sanguineus TaxID=34632 RepID=A0A9D4YQJ4_RHISA|nr:hypothetical protein HPB52_016918 [Rhipicephalus sanguineus]